jgi:xylulokinase
LKQSPLLVGIDIGTTGSRCMVFDASGACVASAHEEYPLRHVKSGWVEQSLPHLLQATLRVCRQVASDPRVDVEAVVSIGLSNQMCATCAATATGELLRPMISWQDVRPVEQLQEITRHMSAEHFQAITGMPLLPLTVLPKILWLRQHEPAVYERAEKWLQIQDIALKHLGADDFFVDVSQMYPYGMWNVPEVKWSEELLALGGLTPDHFGHVVPAGTQVGVLSRGAATRTGFRAGTPLCVGAGDQQCALVGMGAITPDVAAITLGTAAMLTVTLPRPRTDLTEFMLLNHPVANQWALQGLVIGGASTYRWFRDVFGEKEVDAERRDGRSAFDRLNGLAAQAPLGSAGLLFLPYLASAGAPHWNPDARGSFLGIAQHHERAHFARAVMEGVALEMSDSLLRMDGYGLKTACIRLGGGATRSSLWNQIQADVYGRPVQLLQEAESTALGAALLGGVGAGFFAGIDEGVAAMVKVARTIEPDPRCQAHYTELRSVYGAAYESLAASVFGRLARLQAAVPAADA